MAGIPVVFTAHGWAFTDGVSRRRRHLALMLEKLVAPVTAKTIAVSDYDRRLALSHRVCRDSKLQCIHNGVPEVDDRLRADPEKQPPLIVMVSRFQEPKQPGWLVDALSSLDYLSWSAVIVGDGPDLMSVQSQVESLGLMDRVSLPGHLSDVPNMLSDAQIFVLLSRWEGLPLSILEAMRAGLPVIASDVGGVGEAIVDGDTGFLVPAGDAEQLQRMLVLLIEDAAKRRKFGEAGRRIYEEAFSFEVMIERTRALYIEVSQNRKAGGG